MSVPRLTYVELFAGAGGLSLGLEAAGFHPIAHCEIEPNARAVLRYRWPDVRLDGDVTQVNGADFKGVTLISGGSPCQDLSVAGKRKGLAGERSGLFHQQVRIWQESEAPYLLWENVLGALSSNNGRDFGTVLSTLVGAALPVPSDGWRGGGVAAGPDAVAAWRVLDLQHFGPPQRRVRVFVVAARTGGVDPAEVLALSEGLCRHPSPREQSRQKAAQGVRASIEGSGCLTPWDAESKRVFSNDAVFPTLYAAPNSGQQQQSVLAFESTGGSWGVNEGDTAPPIKIGTGLEIASPPAVIAFDTTQITSPANYSNPKPGDACHPLAAGAHAPAIIALDGTDTVGSLLARGDSSPCVDRGQPAVVQDVLPSLPASLANSATGHNKDELIIAASSQWNAAHDTNTAFTLTTMHDPQYLVHPTLNTTHFGKHFGCNQHVNELGTILPAIGRPRRLTPLECERLMSWPDQWTATGVKEDGTEYALSDTARYRLCGNGVGSVCVAWFAQRLADAIRKQHSPLSEGAA